MAGFLSKNKDPLHEDLLLAVRESSLPLLRRLFAQRAPPFGHAGSAAAVARKGSGGGKGSGRLAGPGGGGGGGSRFKGVLQHFQSQLSQLVELLDDAHCSFVRCLKPNSEASPDAFHATQVAEQLRCAGVLEAVQVSRTGYPIRLPFDHFAAEFGVLSP